MIAKPRLPATVVCGVAGIVVGIPGPSVASAQARGSTPAKLASKCAYADAPVTGAPSPILRNAVVCLINQQREERGLPGLSASDRLNNVAQRHTHAMVATRTFSHGTDFAARFTDGGYDWRAAGENIASGYATPLSVVDAWMASRDHCQNILSPLFRNVGTGVAVAGVGTGVGPGTWTEDFGVLMQQSFPSGNARPQNGCPYR